MISKSVSIIAIQEKYLDIMTKQIKKIIGDQAKVHSVTVKDIQQDTISPNDIVVISSPLIKGLISQMIPQACPVVVGKRDINYVNTQRLLKLPQGQQILVVNDNESNSNETVQSLRETVFEHHYEAYLPIEAIPNTIDYIVTPGEQDLLPKGLSNVIDIGPRLLDFNTIEEIISLLKMNYEKSQIVRRYFKACVALSTNPSEQMPKVRDIPSIATSHFEDIIYENNQMEQLVQLAKTYAEDSRISHIHIEGAAGTGKTMLAEAIHHFSSRAQHAFFSLNCAFTDSEEIEKALVNLENKQPPIDSSNKLDGEEIGTVCVDNIEYLTLPALKKLFQLLEEKTFVPHIITTSSKSYKEFSEQDAQLLSQQLLQLPVLSERQEDILPLIENIKQRIQRIDMKLTDEVIHFLQEYEWENNVKELYDVITYLSLLEENPIGMNFLPYYLRSKVDEQKFKEIDEKNEVITKIEKHGFLGESIEILNTFYEGKKEYASFGRYALKKRLEEKGVRLSEQQLRARLEVLQELDLTIVRQGRAGTTISHKGEKFIKKL